MLETASNESISRPKPPFPGNGKGNLKCQWEGKFEACIPGNHGKWEFPLTPALDHIGPTQQGCLKSILPDIIFLIVSFSSTTPVFSSFDKMFDKIDSIQAPLSWL